MSEVLFDPAGVNTGRQLVEIQNTGTAEVSLQGHWLYFPPARWQFPPAATIPPGGVVVVHVNLPGTSTATEFYTGISGMRNLRPVDALAIFRSNRFADPTQILDFVQWGGWGNGGEDVAEAAGIWVPLTFVETSALREGSSIAYDGSGDSPTDWCVDGTPSLGAANDGCSTSYSQSPVILSEIGYVRTGPGQYHPAIELKNVGDVLEDLGGKSVSLANEHSYRFPEGTSDTLLGPNEILVLHLGVSGTNAPLSFYTGEGSFRDFKAKDSVSFHSKTPLTSPVNIIDFVAWGGTGAPLEAAAVGAGIWAAGTFVNTDDRLPRGSIASLNEGTGIERWLTDNTGTIGRDNDVSPQPSLVLNEILVDPVGTGEGQGWVELKNVLVGESIDAGGMALCTESPTVPGTLQCFTIPASTSVPPQGFLMVNVNRSGPDGTGFVNTGPFPDLQAEGGVLLLSLTQKATDVNNLIDYVRWGRGSTAWEDLADERDLWPGENPISTSDLCDGSSIASNNAGHGAEFYRVDRTPSPGIENDEPERQEPFRRGDCNDDGKVDISDPIRLFSFLFLGARRAFCDDACDGNDDNVLDISDPVYVLNFLFRAGPPPRDPGPYLCGADSEVDSLTCNAFLSCGCP